MPAVGLLEVSHQVKSTWSQTWGGRGKRKEEEQVLEVSTRSTCREDQQSRITFDKYTLINIWEPENYRAYDFIVPEHSLKPWKEPILWCFLLFSWKSQFCICIMTIARDVYFFLFFPTAGGIILKPIKKLKDILLQWHKLRTKAHKLSSMLQKKASAQQKRMHFCNFNSHFKEIKCNQVPIHRWKVPVKNLWAPTTSIVRLFAFSLMRAVVSHSSHFLS